MTQMKQDINEVKSQFNPALEIKREFLKYEILKFTVEFSKNKAKLRCEKLSRFEVKLKVLG